MLTNQKHPFSPALNFGLNVFGQGLLGELKANGGSLSEEGEDAGKKWVALVRNYEKEFRVKIVHSSVAFDSLNSLVEEVRKTARVKLIGKRKTKEFAVPLEYLSMREETPKPLPSYLPAIEDEFLMRVARKDKVDEKEMRKKTRKYEKDAIRELKKDTETLMSEKRKEKMQRKDLSRRGTFRAGQTLKDEI